MASSDGDSSAVLVFLFLLIILMIGGGAAWYFFIYKKKPSKSPFTRGNEKNTPWYSIVDGNSEYLDKYDIDCQDKPLGRVQLRPQEPMTSNFADNKWGYVYRCGNGGSLTKDTEQKSTTYQHDGRESGRPLGTTRSLQTHEIDCGKNKAITRLKLSRDSNNKHRFDYQCKSSSADLTCRDVTTAPDGTRDGLFDVRYLERHNVVCNDDEVLNSVKLVDSNTAIQYSYKCCK